MNVSSDLQLAAKFSPTVRMMLDRGATPDRIVCALVDEVLKLADENLRLYQIAPKRIKQADGSYLVWHCPDDLIPATTKPEPAKALAVKTPCVRCAGCGQIADDNDGTPWKYWLELPLQSAVAVQLGLVKPRPCPVCNGTGMEPEQKGK